MSNAITTKITSRIMGLLEWLIDNVLDSPSNMHKLLTGRYENFNAGERLRIVFVLSVDAEWDCFSKIHASFSSSTNAEVVVVADDYPRKNGAHLASNFLTTNGIGFVQSADYCWKGHKPHVIFVADEISTRRNAWILKSKARVVYIPYGTSISAAHYSKQQQYNLPIHNHAWRIFVAGDFVRELYGLYCKKGNEHVVALGHPKSEVMFEVTREYKEPTMSASRESPRIFLWNIHFRHDGLWSTWNEYGAFILNLFASRDDVKLICRPHPFFFDTFKTKDEAEMIKESIVENKNTILDDDSSMKQTFISCDALLTDGSTVIYDFSVTAKPILYLRSTRSEKLHNHAFEFIKKFHYIGDTEQKIQEFVDMVCVVGADSRRKDREKYVLNGIGLASPVGVSKRVAAHIEKELRGL